MSDHDGDDRTANDGSRSAVSTSLHDDTNMDGNPRTRKRGERAEWVLIAVVVLALVVVPVIIYVRPPKLPFRVAFLLLPLAPAVLLGVTAVWIAVNGWVNGGEGGS